ncbi:MAG: glutathione S-transferase family protein [Rubrivivax sp.]|jgi:glutathione S-transferase|nr:glutathione S-transferase family protein [Rubrivivax sp.]
MSLTLYFHPLASYCHKVLIALYEAGTPFTPRIVDLSDAAQRAELASHWPLCKFPVLHDAARGRSVPESTIIIEHLDRHAPGPRPLIPADPDAALDVRLWDRLVDQYVHNPMQEIVLERIRGTGADTAPQRALLDTSYRLIEQQLGTHAWLAGDAFTMADCAAAPALFYATTLQPLPPVLPALGAYFERLMARPSVQRTLNEARPYFRFYPYAEAIPARFR